MGKAQLGPATHQTPTLIGRCVQRPARCRRPAKAKPDRDGHDPANATTLVGGDVRLVKVHGNSSLRLSTAGIQIRPMRAAGLHPPPDAAPGPLATSVPSGSGPAVCGSRSRWLLIRAPSSCRGLQSSKHKIAVHPPDDIAQAAASDRRCRTDLPHEPARHPPRDASARPTSSAPAGHGRNHCHTSHQASSTAAQDAAIGVPWARSADRAWPSPGGALIPRISSRKKPAPGSA